MVQENPLKLQTEFAVDMTCQSCVDSVQTSLRDLPGECLAAKLRGIERYDIDLDKKRVTVVGKTPPSQLYSALKSTNRQVIVRGSSSASPELPTSAAVSILESPIPIPASMATTSFHILAAPSPVPLPGMNEEEFSQKVFGIVRFVQIAPKTILLDLTVRLPPPSNVGLSAAQRAFDVYISSAGNMLDPPHTTGRRLVPLGTIEPDKDGYGDMFKEVPGELWEWIGRGCIVQAQAAGDTKGKIFAGVVARSAGAWGNDKTVCACSGRTMWEEGREMEKSML